MLFVLAFFLCSSVSAHADELQTKFENGVASVFNCTVKPDRDHNDNGEEDAEKLFDGDSQTKWCTTMLQYRDSLTFEFHSSMPIIPTGYIFTTGNDNASYSGRNPKNWTIKAKLNPGDEWTVLATVKGSDALKDQNYADFTFNIDNKKQYKYFSLSISGVNSGFKTCQMSEFRFLISKTDMSSCILENAKSLYSYNDGRAIDLSGIAVKDNGGKPLTQDTDYKITLKDDSDHVVDSVVKPGKYHYVITGIGEYSNSYDHPFIVIDMKTTADGHFLIQSDDEWQKFSETVNNGLYLFKGDTVLLGSNISPTAMVGTSANMFSGTFDGQGHTLTLNYTVTEDYAAPFRYVEDANFKNLTIKGTITTNKKFAAGLAAYAKGSAGVTVSNCESNVTIASSVAGDGTHGGFIGNTDASVTFTNCLFSGAINSTVNTNKCGGFVGWSLQDISLTNCLSTAAFTANASGSATFARLGSTAKINVANSYYKNAFGTEQGTRATAGQLSSGETAWTLQDGQGTLAWGQALGSEDSDTMPALTSDTSKHVYKLVYRYQDGIAIATQYANSTVGKLPDAVSGKALTLGGKEFTAPAAVSADTNVIITEDRKAVNPSIKDIEEFYGTTITPAVEKPEDYDGKITYTSSDNNVVTVNGSELTAKGMGVANITASFASTELYQGCSVQFKFTVDLDTTDIKGEGTAESPYLIKTAKGWDAFADITQRINNGACAKLANDIPTVSTMAGAMGKPYSGTFDGDGHTLNVKYNSTQQYTAPFMSASGATFKNLRIAGTVTTTAKYAAGLVAYATGNGVTIANCESNVAITSNITPRRGGEDGTHGGFVANADAPATITNCLFSGELKGDRTINCGGFVGWSNKSVTLSNCLLMAYFKLYNYNNSLNFSRGNGVSLTNCYYKNKNGSGNLNAQGTLVTDEQLKSGEVAWNLQGSNSSTIWGQILTGDNVDDSPVPTFADSMRVFKVTYQYKDDAKDVAVQYANSKGVMIFPEAVKNFKTTSGDVEFTTSTVLSADAAVKIDTTCIVIDEDKDNSFIDATGKNVYLRRTFAPGTWNTLVLPFDVSAEDMKAVFGDKVQVAYFTNSEQGVIELNTDTAEAGKRDIEANVPVLVKTEGEVANPTFTSRNIVAPAAEAMAKGALGINFVGSYAAVYTVADGQYFISGDKLWKSEGKTTLKATRAYFTVPADEAAGAKLRLVINDGTPTGISTACSDETGGGSYGYGVYTMSGQKVAGSLEEARRQNLKKGVYIANGKKVVLK